MKFLDWIKDALIFIYEDKHDTFIAKLNDDGSVYRIEISPDWKMAGDYLIYDNERRKLTLPALEIE